MSKRGWALLVREVCLTSWLFCKLSTSSGYDALEQVAAWAWRPPPAADRPDPASAAPTPAWPCCMNLCSICNTSGGALLTGACCPVALRLALALSVTTDGSVDLPPVNGDAMQRSLSLGMLRSLSLGLLLSLSLGTLRSLSLGMLRSLSLGMSLHVREPDGSAACCCCCCCCCCCR